MLNDQYRTPHHMGFREVQLVCPGKFVTMETDHKPLVSLRGTKHQDSLPAHVLQFCLRLDRFDYTIKHVSGKHLYTADTLLFTLHRYSRQH